MKRSQKKRLRQIVVYDQNNMPIHRETYQDADNVDLAAKGREILECPKSMGPGKRPCGFRVFPLTVEGM